ncbi:MULTISPECIES: TRAP transporter substrate-binding protein DctP [Aminobacterium]|nr:TRAP transporter substrate-binding protein DctP [Aminobacterium sp. UBA1031]
MKKRLSLLVLVVCFLVLFSTMSLAAVNWKWVHYLPVDSMVDNLSKDMIKEIEERSNGQIKFTLFPAGQLGDWMEMSEQMMRGSIQIGILPVSPVYNKALQIRVLPYSVMNWNEARKAFTGADPFLFNILSEEMEKVGFKALAVVAEGFGGAGFADTPDFDLVDPDANKHGYKMRVPAGNQAFESLAQQLGFIPASVPWGEIYIALQTKLIDSQIGGQPYNTYASFLDITKTWVQYNTHFQHSFVYMNKKAWEALSPDLQKIVKEVAQKYADTSFAIAEAEDKSYMGKMSEAGIKVIIPTDEQLKKIATKVRKNTWPIMENVVGKEVMDKALSGLGITK